MTTDENATVVTSEPDAWETAQPLYTNEVLGIALCKYTARPVQGECPERASRQHVDESCVVMYWSTPAILSGNIPTEMAAPIVTANDAGITFVSPVEP
jgi:hypothetical protein